MGPVALGIVLVVVNDFTRFGPNLLPGGHKLYLFLIIGRRCLWRLVLGIFDRPA